MNAYNQRVSHASIAYDAPLSRHNCRAASETCNRSRCQELQSSRAERVKARRSPPMGSPTLIIIFLGENPKEMCAIISCFCAEFRICKETGGSRPWRPTGRLRRSRLLPRLLGETRNRHSVGRLACSRTHRQAESVSVERLDAAPQFSGALPAVRGSVLLRDGWAGSSQDAAWRSDQSSTPSSGLSSTAGPQHPLRSPDALLRRSGQPRVAMTAKPPSRTKAIPDHRRKELAVVGASR